MASFFDGLPVETIIKILSCLEHRSGYNVTAFMCCSKNLNDITQQCLNGPWHRPSWCGVRAGVYPHNASIKKLEWIKKYFKNDEIPWIHRNKICRVMAKVGHLEGLQRARKNDYNWDIFTCSYAAWGGHLDVLQWARRQGCDWDEYTCDRAALGGHLEVLKWARANGCAWDEFTCSSAAKGGHLEVLKWARANGCMWTSHTCVSAADRGHLKVLKWARANNCVWDKLTYQAAKKWGDKDVVKWLLDNGCPTRWIRPDSD